MGRRKTIEKGPVTVRFKQLANGNQSIYLDIYKDGKRTYDFLKLYIVPEVGRNKTEARRKNTETMTVVNAIKAQRVLDLKNGMSGIAASKSKMNLLVWLDEFEKYKLKNSRSPEKVGLQIHSVRLHLIKYKGENVRLCDVDKKYCLGFIDYLKKSKRSRGGTPLKPNTIKMYYSYLNEILGKAMREGIIVANPINELDKKEKPKRSESNRVYLDIEEVRKLADTDFYDELTKQAFMFSCFCGLRISDIKKLRWSDMRQVTDRDGIRNWYLSIVQQKTNRTVSFVLPSEALKWMPEKGSSKFVFAGLKTDKTLNAQIKLWTEAAGIDKKVTFHTARHTFGTMMLTLGADLYTTSKLMGHSNIATTEIYAKIIDKKKDEAMGLIDKFFDK